MIRPRRGGSAFFDGARAFFRGIGFLFRNPRFFPWVIAPTILNLALFVALTYITYRYYGSIQALFFEDRDEWYWVYTGARYFSWLIFLVLIAVFWFFTFVFVGSKLTAPFNEVLSQKVEEILIPDLVSVPAGVWRFIEDVLRGMVHAVRRELILLLWIVVLLPLHLVAGVGSIAYTVLLGYVCRHYLAWEGLDYSLSRRRLSFARKHAYVRRHAPRTSGFGVVVYCLLFFPPTTLFVWPVLAIGGTMLYCEVLVQSGDDGEEAPE